jgi:hypothetical protein
VSGAEVLTLYTGTNDLILAHSMYVRGKPEPCGGSDGQRCLRATMARFRANYGVFKGRIAAADLRGMPHVDVHQAFNGPNGDLDPIGMGHVLPLPDGVHPSNAGHAAIADLMRDSGYAPLYTPPAS